MNIFIIDMDNLKNPHWAGGQARGTREIGKRLVKMGHDVTVICSKYPNYADYNEDGIKHHHIGLASDNSRFNNVCFLLALPFAVRKIRADIILESFTAPFSVSFAPLFTKTPVVGYATFFAAGEMKKKYKLPFDLLERFGLKFYKYIVALNGGDERKIRQVNSRMISRVIPDGVGDEYFDLPRGEAKHLLFIGRFDVNQKGIDLLLHAYAKIKDRIGYPLVIGGHGQDEDKILLLIHELKLEKQVKMIGSTYGEKKFRALSEAVCAALPSRFETFSIFGLEALASGLPLVIFDIPGLSWSDSLVALKAKAFDVEEYAQCLIRATEPSLNAEMSRQARVFALRFRWDNIVSEFDVFFKQVLSKSLQH
jgi:glycosyltransferase involved in cell wall biosynthesis